MSETKTYSFNKSLELFRRAGKVIPQGIYGHMTPALVVPGSYPYYAVRGQGCRYWDVDGNEFIDYMCGYGPMVLGYGHPKVEEAVAAQKAKGNCFNHPSERMVELAELLVDTIPMADWAVFAKNGSDMTTWATQVAREYTQRKKIVMVKGTYHGAHAWCTPGHGGIIDEDRIHIHSFTWNRADQLEDLVNQYKGQIAGVIMTPYHHPTFGDSVLPAPGFWNKVQQICNREGIVLIIDDVRAGWRLDIRGSHEYFGFTPDLVTFCKAMGNTYPISATVGKKELMNAASKVFLTGSYWNSAVPMAAAIATIKALKEEAGVQKMMEMGKLLCDGLIERGKAYGYEIIASGPYTIPFYRFGIEDDFYRQQVWCSEVTKRGSFFHPHHNWFISAAHDKKDIAMTLDHAEAAFKVVKAQFGD